MSRCQVCVPVPVWRYHVPVASVRSRTVLDLNNRTLGSLERVEGFGGGARVFVTLLESRASHDYSAGYSGELDMREPTFVRLPQ